MIPLPNKFVKAFSLACVFSSSVAFAQDDWRLNNRISIGSDFVYMRRAVVNDTSLVLNSGSQAICTKDLINDMWFEPGLSAEIIGYCTEKSTLQISGTYVKTSTGTKSVASTGNISFPFSVSGYASDYTAANQADTTYTARYYEGEFNYIHHVTPPYVNYFAFAWIVGLRYLEFNESLNLQFFKGSDASNFIFRTTNHLGGVQFGGNLQLNFSKSWSWDLIVKVAAMANHLRGKVYLGNANNSVTLRDYQSTNTEFSILANPKIALLFHPSRFFSLNIGYEALVLNDVAVAGDQVTYQKFNTATSVVNHHGLAVFHGLSAGLNLSF